MPGVLVAWDRSAADALADFLTSQEWPFHAGGTPTREDVLARISSGAYDGPEVRTFWIVEDGSRVGVIRLYDLADENVEFDIRLAVSARGRGLGTAAVRELTGWVFASLPHVVRVEATTRADNLAMRRVLSSCGYAQEALHRAAWPTADGRRLDSAGYAILRPGLSSGMPRLQHVRVNVTDLDRSIAWYEALLGVPAEVYWPPDAPEYAHFQAGPTLLALSVLEPRPGGARLNLTVDDVDAWWERLRDRATVIEPLFDTPYGMRKFTIADPDGNELGLMDR